MKPGEVARSVSRGAFYLSIEKVAALLSGIVYFALLLRWLGPSKYGLLTLALSFSGLATTFTGNLEMFLERFTAEYQARGDIRTLRRAQGLALAIKLGIGAVAGAALVLLAPFLADQFDASLLRVLLPALVAFVVFDGLSTTGRATLYGLQRYRLLGAISVAFHFAKTAMVGLLWWLGEGVLVLAVGLSVLAVLSGLAFTLAPLAILRRVERDMPEARPAEPHGELLRRMLRYCVPLLGARVTFLSGQNLGKIVIGKVFDATTLGYFAFAYQTIERFVEVAHTLPSALLPSLTHLVARGERERLRHVFNQAFRLIQVAACGLSLALFAFAPEITLLVGSALFTPAVPLLRVMALVPIVRTGQQPLTMLFQALSRPGTVLRLALLKFGTEYTGYLLMVAPLGILGAGVANLSGAIVSFGAALAAAGRHLSEGAEERLRATAAAIWLTLPFVALVPLASLAGPGLSLALRIGIVLGWMLGVFAFRLVNGYDLEKLAALPLEAAPQRTARDWAVALAGRLVRRFEPGRAA